MRRLAPYAAAFGVYLLIAVIVTYPLITQLSSAFVGYVHGDAYEMAHHIWWINHALATGQNPFFAANLAYPDGINGVTLWSHPLQFFPAWLFAFVLPLPAAANLTILLTLALNGAAMFWLAQRLITTEDTENTEKTSRAAALVAGLVFMLYPTMQGHLGAGHAGLMVQWGVPLLIGGLYRLRGSGRFSGVALTALGLVLSAGGHILQIIYVALPLFAAFGLWFIVRRERAALLRLMAAGVVGGACALIFALPSARAAVSTSAYDETGDTVRYSADLLAIVTPSFNHPLFGRLDYTHRVLGVNLDEGAAYFGVIAAALALIALVRVRESRLWAGIALAAWILSLGVLLKLFDQPVQISADAYRSYIPLPFALVTDLPIFNLARTPGRFAFLLAAAAALLTAYGAATLWQAIKAPIVRIALFIVIGAGIAFEYQTFFPLPLTRADVPAGVAALAGRDDVRAVFSAPWNHLVAAKTDLYWHTAHGHPLIAGQVTRQTPVDPAKLTLLQTFDPALLDAAGADVVLIHRAFDAQGTLEAAARSRLGDPFYEDERVALFEALDPTAPPAFALSAPPAAWIDNTADVSLYAPQAGWGMLDAALTGNGNASERDRAVLLLLDDLPVRRWQVGEETPVRLPVPLDGYHTLRFALDPPCPITTDPTLECASVWLNVSSVDFTAADHGAAARFDGGIALTSAHARQTDPAVIEAWLLWRFDQPRGDSDIRFVHVVDAAGTLVGQHDSPLGTLAAGSAWAEAVSIPFESPLPPGEYRVFVGWYAYPSIAPFCPLDEAGACADANRVQIGAFRVE